MTDTNGKPNGFIGAFQAVIDTASMLLAADWGEEGNAVIEKVAEMANLDMGELDLILKTTDNGILSSVTVKKIRESLSNLNGRLKPYMIRLAVATCDWVDADVKTKGYKWSTEPSRKLIVDNSSDSPDLVNKSMHGIIYGLVEGKMHESRMEAERRHEQAKTDLESALNLPAPKLVLGGKIGRSAERAERKWNRLSGQEQNEIRRRAAQTKQFQEEYGND